MDIPSNLLPTRLDTADYQRVVYFHRPALGVTAEMVVHPDYWLHLAARLKLDDKIEVVSADGSIDMDLRVVAIDPRGLYAQMRVLRFTGEGAPVVAPAPVVAISDNHGYMIEEDRVQGWRVLRGDDLIAKNLPDKAAAEAARDAHRAGKPIKRAA